MHRIPILALVAAAALFGIESDRVALAQGAFPSGPIEIIVPGSPGGGWDTTARAMQAVLASTGLVKVPITIVNRPGAGGQVGWSYLNEHQGNPHYLAMNSNQLFPRQLMGQTKMKFEDFTPLARLTTEYVSLSVRPDAPYKTGKELLDALKQDPTKHVVSVGSGQASSDHVSFLRAARAAGIDVRKLRVVVHSSGADQMAAILGGHVDVASTGLSEAIEQARAGKLRLIAVTAPERVKEAPDVPTWKEMGIEGTWRHWRGIMGAGKLEPTQVAAWDKILGDMVKSQAWKAELEKRGWTDAYLDSKAFTRSLHEERDAFAVTLREAGLIQQ
jgi:tripartite-type tricarboxylate transporter receptor subunit TctC